ncbi:MAG: conjugal transfer protein TraX [Lachnospiraceae bacterium]|nr:conjugal transfer protein TraX [Lachnospiraceae bacterium]
MKRIVFTNAGLKNIAYVTMFIDHFFAVVIMEMIRRQSAAGYETDLLRQIYSAGRAVGRISFVLFAYLAVEGFLHTRSRRAYLSRLGIFALVSEVPFDLAFSGEIVDRGSQNVFFTLFLGVFTLTVWEWAGNNVRQVQGCCPDRRDRCWWAYVIAFRAVQSGTVACCCVIAYALHTDYKYMGVLLIFTFYLMHDGKLIPKIVLAGCVMLFGIWSVNCLRYRDSELYTKAYLFRFSMRELYGLTAFVPIILYDGSKGRQLPKAVCYGFYPVHLLILHWVVKVIWGNI